MSLTKMCFYLPFEDITFLDEAGGESLDWVLVQLGQLFPQKKRRLTVFAHWTRSQASVRSSKSSPNTISQDPGK